MRKTSALASLIISFFAISTASAAIIPGDIIREFDYQGPSDSVKRECNFSKYGFVCRSLRDDNVTVDDFDMQDI